MTPSRFAPESSPSEPSSTQRANIASKVEAGRWVLLPVEEALARLPSGTPIESVSGRGLMQVLSHDSLGMLVQLGPQRRIAGIPWPALEGSLSLLQFGAEVPIRGWPPALERPRAISDMTARWTGYASAPLWVSALLRQAGLVEIHGGRSKHLRLLPGRIDELDRWNANWAALSEEQRDALEMEAKTAVFYVLEGLHAVAGLNERNDFFPTAFQLLGSGLEHLFKLTLALGRLHVDGALPTRKELRSTLGHDLKRTRDEVLALIERSHLWQTEIGHVIHDLLWLGSAADEFLDAASTYLERGRFHYLDVLLGGAGARDPRDAYLRLEHEIVELTSDPEEEPRSMPGLYWTAETAGLGAYFQELNAILLDQLVTLTTMLAELCCYFHPLKDPGVLSHLMYVASTEDPPARWNEARYPRRPRFLVDHALCNDRWQRRLQKELSEGA